METIYIGVRKALAPPPTPFGLYVLNEWPQKSTYSQSSCSRPHEHEEYVFKQRFMSILITVFAYNFQQVRISFIDSSVS